jgi:hypothetical protein
MMVGLFDTHGITHTCSLPAHVCQFEACLLCVHLRDSLDAKMLMLWMLLLAGSRDGGALWSG